MKFNFRELDAEIRQLMQIEFDFDVTSELLYNSKRFSAYGIEKYPDFFKQSITNGDEETLATALTIECFNEYEDRNSKNGVISVKVPVTANVTFAEGEFNRFYIRAICRKAIANNEFVTAYRARNSEKPRTGSEELLGKLINPTDVLNDLRKNIGIDTALGLPNGPNSGLSIERIIIK
ncbi:hypothetical protein Q765_04390 [Flavobacterium rivuli WB 3.3-2 = DSM 21788]|uniref:Uncharacterized protein n=2 Tax=Flavobacterium rivuli TaxID=498301 RepID=A0A0A2M524_9FLAO|nr:hypothetical protein Q765_04390 [Flavobacterium rivuli WB 3.3-2 = DSM 21788]